ICLTTTTTTVWGWADVLALVDRSSSMGLSMAGDEPCAPAGTHCTTRWDAVRSALLNLVPWQSHVRWGTLVFPSPGAESCAVGPTPQVPVMENAADAIGRAMSSVAPGGESPTGAAIRAAVAYLGDLADRDVKGIVLFTDGEPGCGGVDGGAAWAEALDAAAAAEAQGYPLFVFGLGPNPGDLDRLARAGGTDLYYPATSGQQLDDALGSIFWNPGDFVRSCSFATYEPPPDPTRVYVFLNGEPIPRDSNDGWSFGSQNSYIVLNGESCERLQSLDAVELAILFGCGDAGSP
ncbi:MAG: VWA domain-containing protein, partial [Deltaproteobacteria bacterium]|nr:VWA domain-containing protein [Deltaproteobacteria bacterium]